MRVRRLAGALAAGGAAGAGLAAFAWRASKQVELSEVVVPVAGLPAGLDGLRILHIADTHFPANGESLERFLEAARGRNYDLVVATGDYADTADGWPVVVEAFRQLDAKLGVYASLGGHERYPGLGEVSSIWMGWRAIASRIRPRRLIDPAPLIAALEAEGVRVLVNENLSLEIEGELVRLIAVDDAYMGLADLEAALPAPDSGGFRLLLSHSPDGLLHPRSGEVDLALCGHTHGGQITFPLLGAPVRHARSVGRREPAGLLRIGGVTTFVSRGFGTSLLPLRLGARPELAVVELRRA